MIINGDSSVTITSKILNVLNLSAKNKVYDGTTDVEFDYSLFIVNGVLLGDDVDVVASGSFENKNVAENITVSYEYTLNGSSKDNYILDTTSGTLTANITRKGITISNIKVNDKYYDGNTSATVNLDDVIYGGIIENESLSVTVDAAFVDESCGSNKVISLTNLVLAGDNKDNYYLNDDYQTETTASILKAIMTCSAEGYNGFYDKEEHIITITDTLDDITITYSNSENGEYAAENISYVNAGTYTVYYKIEKDNYETIIGSANIVINKKEVTISNIKANDKEYDGKTDATLDYSNIIIEGLFDGDSLTISADGAFADKNAGNNKTVNITNIELSNSSYVLANDSLETKASISTKLISVENIEISDKKYDKTTDAKIANYSILGIIGDDDVKFRAKASFVDEEAGTNKKVIFSDVELYGEDQANYIIELNQLSATGNIIKAETKGLAGGAVAGIIIGGVVVSGLIGFALYWFIFKKKKA